MNNFPLAWPWMAHLDKEDLAYLHNDLREIADEPDLDKAIAALNQFAHEWRATAEAISDPKIKAALTGPLEGDFGPVYPSALPEDAS